MNQIHTLTSATLVALSLAAQAAWAQHHHEHQPAHNEPALEPTTEEERLGNPYPLAACPISGQELSVMGDPRVKLYEGRAVRFCCAECPAKFEADLVANISHLDEKIAEDQRPLYPLRTSIITGKDLLERPYEFVYGNRLVLLGSEDEKAQFLAKPNDYLHELDEAVIAEQGAHYPLKTCPVSGDDLGGDMDEPKDVVIAGRLIRLCCDDCKNDIETEPAKFIAMIDAAWGRGDEQHGHEQDGHHGHESKPHGHK